MSIEQYPSANGVLTSLIWRKTAVGGETSLSGYDNASQALSYTPGQEQVYLNGILLVRGSDYTATNGTSITGLTALVVDDFIQINCYNNFSLASLPAASITGEVTNSQITSLATTKLTGTVANNQLANSSITINGSAVALGGSVSLPGDIESVTATSPLTGGGTTGALTVGIQSASTSQAGSVQLSDSTSTTSSVLAATPTAVKSAYDLANDAIPKTLTTTTGDIIYASSASTPARLGIGSSAQVLTVSGGIPSWATASAGSMTLLGSTNLSGLTTYTFSSINQGYKMLFLEFVNATYNTGDTLRVCPNGIASNATGIVFQTKATAASSIAVASNTITGGWSVGLVANAQSVNSQMTIYNYADTSKNIKPIFSIYHKWTPAATTNINASELNWGGFQASSASAYDGIVNISSLQVHTANGQFNSGYVYLYGVK